MVSILPKHLSSVTCQGYFEHFMHMIETAFAPPWHHTLSGAGVVPSGQYIEGDWSMDRCSCSICAKQTGPYTALKWRVWHSHRWLHMPLSMIRGRGWGVLSINAWCVGAQWNAWNLQHETFNNATYLLQILIWSQSAGHPPDLWNHKAPIIFVILNCHTDDLIHLFFIIIYWLDIFFIYL